MDITTIQEDIIAGKIYAHVESVAPSGMSRRILFYRIVEFKDNEPTIQNITCAIGEISQTIKSGQVKQGTKYIFDYGLKVDGCGMDMVFATLYNCLDEEERKEWQENGQRYRTL